MFWSADVTLVGGECASGEIGKAPCGLRIGLEARETGAVWVSYGKSALGGDRGGGVEVRGLRPFHVSFGSLCFYGGYSISERGGLGIGWVERRGGGSRASASGLSVGGVAPFSSGSRLRGC